ncbi:hypothetical protein ACM66B_002811 [Microbotryomycetes sp. NB124-2]
MPLNPVLTSAYSVEKHSTHVKLDRQGCERAAQKLVESLTKTPYTVSDWAAVPLHPSPTVMPPLELLHWIFLVSTLNFSFWSDLDNSKRFAVEYKTGVDGKETYETDSETGKQVARQQMFTGYFSLLAALHRARDEGINVVNPQWYAHASEDEIRRVFRSDQEEEMPLLDERIRVLREVGSILCERFNGSFATLVEQAGHSALKLVELVVSTFPCYDDKSTYPATSSESIYVRKRAQILIAETWAAFQGQGYGRFDDIDEITMFADYRVPQILHSLGTISYSSHLEQILKDHLMLEQGSPIEVEVRCLSIVAVEEIRRAIGSLLEQRDGQESRAVITTPNAVLLDFLLWDLAKVEEAEGKAELPHHRTRSVFY